MLGIPWMDCIHSFVRLARAVFPARASSPLLTSLLLPLFHLHLPHSHWLPFEGPISWNPIRQAFTEFPGRVSILFHHILIVNHSPYTIFHCLISVYSPWYKLYWGQMTVSHFNSQWLVQCQTQRGCSVNVCWVDREGKLTQNWTTRAQSQFLIPNLFYPEQTI